MAGAWAQTAAEGAALASSSYGSMQRLEHAGGFPVDKSPASRSSSSQGNRAAISNCIFESKGTGIYGTDQCASSSAWKLASPESNDPVIAVAASTPRGKSTLVIEAMKIAAIGRAMTK